MPPTKPNPAAPEGEIVRAIREEIKEAQRIANACDMAMAKELYRMRVRAFERCLEIIAEHAARAGAGKRGKS